MNRPSLTNLTLLAIILFALPGCIIVSKNETHRHEPIPPCGGDATYVEHDTTIAEIRAARDLSFSSERADHLCRIARRQGLGPRAQVCLVDTAFKTLSFENEKMRVLQTLIANPDLNSAGKARILERLGKLSFSNNREQILTDLDNHGPVIDVVEEPAHEEHVIITIPAKPVQDETPNEMPDETPDVQESE